MFDYVADALRFSKMVFICGDEVFVRGESVFYVEVHFCIHGVCVVFVVEGAEVLPNVGLSCERVFDDEVWGYGFVTDFDYCIVVVG